MSSPTSTTLLQFSKDFTAARTVAQKLSETLNNFQVHSRSLAEQCRDLESNLLTLNHTLQSTTTVNELVSSETGFVCTSCWNSTVELEKFRVSDQMREEMKRRKEEIEALREEMVLERARVGTLSVKLERRESEIREGSEAREREINERIREAKEEIELKEKCIDEGMKMLDEIRKAIELREEEVMRRSEALELRKKVVDERVEMVELKEKRMEEVCKALLWKEKAVSERERVVESKEKGVGGHCEAKVNESVEVKERKMSEDSQVVEIKEKRRSMSGITRDLSDNQVNECSNGTEFAINAHCQLAETDEEHVDKLKLEEMQGRASVSMDSAGVALCSLCGNMDALGVRSYLIRHVKERNVKEKIAEALKCAPDPAKLVVDVTRSLLKTSLDKLCRDASNTSCILLLEQFMSLSPSITPLVQDEAKIFAAVWESTLKGQNHPADKFGFLQFLAAYKIASSYPVDELLSCLSTIVNVPSEVYRPEQIVCLCRALGLADKIPDHVRSLIEQQRLILAVRYICVFKLELSFPPVPLLESYFEFGMKRAEDRLAEGTCDAKEAGHLKSEVLLLAHCTSTFKLETRFPSEFLWVRIKQLKGRKINARCSDMELPRKHLASSSPSVVPSKREAKRPRVHDM